MPPGGKLKPDEIAALREWIKDGAYWPPEEPTQAKKSSEYVITPEQRAFWSFQPVKHPAIPESCRSIESDRCVHTRPFGKGRSEAFTSSRQTHLDSTRHHRPNRIAAFAGRS